MHQSVIKVTCTIITDNILRLFTFSISLFLLLTLFIISLFTSSLSTKVSSSSLTTFSASFSNAMLKSQVNPNMSINLQIRQSVFFLKKKKKKESLYIQSFNVFFSMPSKTTGFLMLLGGIERELRVVMD